MSEEELDDTQPVTIDEWRADVLANIEKYVAHWKAQHEKDPDNFPEQAYLGEWDEQFALMTEDLPAPMRDDFKEG